MLVHRILSALLGAPIILAATWAGGPWLAGIVAALAFLGGREWLRLTAREQGPSPAYKAVFLAAVLTAALLPNVSIEGVLADFQLRYSGGLLLAGLLFVVFAAALTAARWSRGGGVTPHPLPGGPFVRGLIGVLYIGLPFAHWPALREAGAVLGSSWAPGAAFWVLMVVWAGDIAAYSAGSALGRRKLAPHISPNKSIEGALAGLGASIVLGGLLHRWTGLAFAPAAFIAGITGAMAQLGDLWESMVKRGAGMKDSGALIPGHGGILDRFDALLFAFPVAYHLLIFFPSA